MPSPSVSVGRAARAHPENEISLRQNAMLHESLEDQRATHEAQDFLSGAYIEQARLLFNQAREAIIRLKIAKRRGQ